MAEITFSLENGLTKFGKLHQSVTIRSVTGGDIIDATQESERLIFTPEGPALIASPSLTGAHITRRRIVKIGDINGPLDLDLFKELSGDDLGLIQTKCEELDTAHGREAAKLLEKTGRDEGAGSAG